MINFDAIEARLSEYTSFFKGAKPFSHLIIDDFCDAAMLNSIVDKIPDPVQDKIAHSRDYVFAKNKFEKSAFRGIAHEFDELYVDLMSDRFQQILCTVTGEKVFVDPAFHGGGLHQGGFESFLDMHVDFNYHPLHKDWFRNLNILLYLNRGWKTDYAGELKLRHMDSGEATKIPPIFNRCVIMSTRSYTLHGYDKISFPPGSYRRSLATYAYSLTNESTDVKARSTIRYPEKARTWKVILGRNWPKLVKIKNYLLGSSTSKN